MIGINRYRIDKIRAKNWYVNLVIKRGIFKLQLDYLYNIPSISAIGCKNNFIENENEQTHDFIKATFYPDINNFPDN